MGATVLAEIGKPHSDAEGLDRRPAGRLAASVWLESAPAWLASALIHLGALLLLALLAWRVADDLPLGLVAVTGEEGSEALVDAALLDSLDSAAAPDATAETFSVPPLEPLTSIAPDAPAPVSSGGLKSAEQVGPAFALSGRAEGAKEAMLGELGGSAESEDAVLRGLLWLQRRQKSDGGWSLVGPFEGGVPVRRENRVAATAMALLAFQGAGKLPTSPRNDFGPTVRKGWDWLLEQQQPNGSFFVDGPPTNHRFYTEAQCTIAVCELLAMTGDDAYRDAATRAVAYLVESQSEQGGWKYTPASRSDLSVTGWVLMALKSARMAGISVSSTVFADIERFLDTVSRGDIAENAPRGSRYVYEESDTFISEAIPTLTAVGLLSRQYLGWSSEDPRLRSGLRFLLTHPPRWAPREADVYYWYYASQACLHAGGSEWPKWNGVMRDFLIDKQQRRGQAEPGSWNPDFDIWGRDGGRLYTTCLSIYTLEVYYRHLPLYQQRAVR